MSPELINAYLSQGLGASRTERTMYDDLWASAATFYEMLSGSLPFGSIMEIINSNPNPLPSHVPRELCDIVEKSLRKDISQRFPSAREMRATLEEEWNRVRQREEKQTIADTTWLEKEGRRREAEEKAENKQVKLSEEDYCDRAVECYNAGDYDGVIQNCSKAIELNPQNAEIYISCGLGYFEKGDYDQAIKDFDRAIKLNPQNTKAYEAREGAYHLKAMASYESGDYDQAIKDFSRLIELNPQYAEAYAIRGNLYHEKGNYDQAIKDFSKIVELHPYAPNYHIRGNTYLKKGDYDQAIADFTTAIELDSAYADAYMSRAEAYLRKKEIADKVIEDCNKVIKLNPQTEKAYVYRAAGYIEKEDYDQAIKDCNKAIELNPQSGEAYAMRGLVYLEKEHYDQAIKDFNKAAVSSFQYGVVDPEEVYYHRGRSYYKNGNYDQAIKGVSKVVESVPHGLGYKLRGRCHLEKEDYDQAIADFTTAIELDPIDTNYNDRGFAYYLKGNYDQAIKDLTNAIELNPQVVEPYNTRAAAYKKLGQNALAEADRQKHEERLRSKPVDFVAAKERKRREAERNVQSGIDQAHRDVATRFLAYLKDPKRKQHPSQGKYAYKNTFVWTDGRYFEIADDIPPSLRDCFPSKFKDNSNMTHLIETYKQDILSPKFRLAQRLVPPLKEGFVELVSDKSDSPTYLNPVYYDYIRERYPSAVIMIDIPKGTVACFIENNDLVAGIMGFKA